MECSRQSARDDVSRRTVRILGSHGVPASYGGLETAAEHVALHLVNSGWRVIVYCLEYGDGPVREDVWNGIERVIIPVDATPPAGGKMRFDIRAIAHASRRPGDVWLSLGYNTALFNVVNRVRRIPVVINMDGVSWARARWGRTRQAMLWANERIACAVGNALIADHPEIETRLAAVARPDKVRMITYGAPDIVDASTDPLADYGLESGRFATVICRPIPENSLIELVSGYSARERGMPLVVLGNLRPDDDPYHRQVLDAAGDEVRFIGAVYDQDVVASLRFHSVAYLHGHTVGGTNPSLVEAMGAGNPIIAHDNKYNRWTAGPDAARYFSSVGDVDRLMTEVFEDADGRRRMSQASRERFRLEFTWERVAEQYEKLLAEWAG